VLIVLFSGLNGGFGNASDWKDSLQAGLTQHYLGDFPEAERLLRSAVDGVRAHGRKAEIARALAHLGDLYLSEDRFADAEDVFDEAISLYKESERETGSPDAGTVAALRSLGTAFALEGEVKKALAILNDASRQAKRHFSSDVRLSAIVLNSLGMAYVQDGNFKKAEALFQQVLAVQSAAGSTEFLTANVLNNLAQVHREQRKYQEAETEYKRCIEISEQLLGPSHPEIAITRGSLGMLYMRMGRLPEAEDQLVESLRITEAARPVMAGRIVRILHILTAVYERQGKWSEAEDVLARAAAVARSNPQHDPETAIVLDAYSAILKRSGKTDLARAAHVEADRARASMALTTTLHGLR
jgi:tetratricopeptide (TPR) repeat protein